MVLNSDDTIGLYVAIVIYFLLLAAASIVAFHWKKKTSKSNPIKTQGDAMEGHFLANRSFGYLLTTGTVFASVFSGYTVVGVPTQAFSMGWISLQWAACLPVAVLSFLVLAPRLRKIGVMRKHQSPIDMITDRFQSQILRYTTTLLMIFPTLIYLTAQLAAIRSTFNSLFEIRPDSPWAVIIIAGVIVLFEWIGGMRSVALTDCIQGIVMISCFVCLPIIVLRHCGGWVDLDWQTYPRQSFYQTPSRDQQWMYWNFATMFLGMGMNPHLLQRIYAADSFKSLKIAYSVLSIGPWFAFLPGIFLGTIGVQWLADLGVETTSSPFASILEAVMDLGGFPYVVGIIASTATLAAIMSTADSILIAVSHLVTNEFILPAFAKASPTTIGNIGRVTSLFTMALGLIIAFYGGQNIVELISIQNGLLLTILPVYVIAMYDKRVNPHPWTMAFAAICGSLAVGILHFTYGQRDMKDQPFVFAAGIAGVLLNLALIAVVEFIRYIIKKLSSDQTHNSSPSRSTWDTPDLSRFCGGNDVRVSGDFIWNAMKGIREPVVDYWFLLFVLAASILLTPITEPNMPPLGDDGNLLWAPNVIRGMPSWAFQVLMVLIPVTVVMLYAIYAMPNNLFSNERGEENDNLLTEEVKSSLMALDTTVDKNDRTKFRRWNMDTETEIRSNVSSDESVSVDDGADDMDTNSPLDVAV